MTPGLLPVCRRLQRQRRRKPRLTTATALLLCSVVATVLLPPWNVFAGASELSDLVEPPLYTAEAVGLGLAGLDLGLDGVGFGGARVEKSVEKRSSYEREEQNGVVNPQNVDWGDSWTHHLAANLIFARETGGQRAMELRKRGVEEEEEDLGKRRQQGVVVHLTFNTCLQPTPNITAKGASSLDPPPPLQVFVSNSSSNKSPGPYVEGKVQYVVDIDHGFGSLDIFTTGDIWVGVYASRLPSSSKSLWNEKPPWNYELALSTNEPYHGYRDQQYLYLVDTDDSTALLITGNMTTRSSKDGGIDETESNLKDPNFHPYTMYAQNQGVRSPFLGLEKSYCAVRQLAQIEPAKSTDVSGTTRGLGNLPKQQFHLKELNRTSKYSGYLARPRNNSPSDTSGIIWSHVDMETKNDGNCQIIYNLPFCSEVAYAVPSNPTVFGPLALKSFYDDLAGNWWMNFTYSLQQIQCNASSSAAYSPVRNCDDCAAAYKNWLCAVTIPRCMDYSSNLTFLAERSSNKLFWNSTSQAWQKHPHMPGLSQVEIDQWKESGGWLTNGNQSMSRVPSRNTKIDEIVMPGAYKEVRPCMDLCWSLAQSCPSQLGFTCPREHTWGKERSYGERAANGDVTCSYLGAVYFLSGASRARDLGVAWWAWVVLGAVVMWFAS